MIGIIGGSGLEDPKMLKDFKEIDVKTGFGTASVTEGNLDGIKVAIVSRHGKKHTIMPTDVNSRANIQALKERGCTHILATSACGSLKEEIRPGDFVVVDQFIDRTTKRKSTFYSDKVCHIPMADPFCNKLRELFIETGKELNLKIHERGTVVTIEGPRFSTRAESRMFIQWGGDVINMSTVPECVLAREAGLCYSVVCMATDYDCFSDKLPDVDIVEILRVMKQNADNVKNLLKKTVLKVKHTKCECMESYKTAVIGG